MFYDSVCLKVRYG